MKYKLNKEDLFDELRLLDGFLKRKVHLIACGGTALTLLGVKASTKDVDLVVPNLAEYEYLKNTLNQLGYVSASGWGWSRAGGFIFDLFRGKRVHTTELLDSPLDKGKHLLVKEFSYIYLGVLNYYDIIISKLFRGTRIDMEDCIALMRHKREEIDIKFLIKRFRETASFEISEEKVNRNLDVFLKYYQEKDSKNG